MERLQELPDLVEEAASQLEVDRPNRGRKQKLDPEQKNMLFLFARLTQKRNRNMEAILSPLGPAFGVDVSYKTIERLYSDDEVKMVLKNLFQLLLEKADVSGDVRETEPVILSKLESTTGVKAKRTVKSIGMFSACWI